ncbi:MAG: HAD hydrolase-like protein [Rhodobacteraceae bacterium]|nr:HAD hydrolase-like protein [Paracoccaceae bacterium]
MGLQALIFDVDGTVAETADLHRAAFNRAFAEHGLSWHWDREIFSQLAPVEFSLPKLRLFSVAMRRSGQGHVPSHSELANITKRKAHIFCQSVREGAARLRPGVVRLMQEALHEGLSIGAVSTSSRAETQALLIATLGFHNMHWITSLKTAEDAQVPAAERSLYKAVLDDFDIVGRRAFAIDDSASGALAASRNGIPVLATPSMYSASSRFDNAALTISDLGQPAEPFTVISGKAYGHPFVSPALLRALLALKAEAA